MTQSLITILFAILSISPLADGAQTVLRSSPGDDGMIDVATVLAAESDVIGMRRNGFDDAIAIMRLDSERAVLFQNTSGRRGNGGIARIIRINDGRILCEKIIIFHALNSGASVTTDAMRVFGGQRVAFAGTNGEIFIWDIASDRISYLLKKLEDVRVGKMEFSADGRLFIDSAQGLQVWDVDRKTLLLNRSPTAGFAFNHIGNLITEASDGFDEIDTRSYDLIRHYSYTFPSSPVGITSLPDGRILEQAYTGEVRVWDLEKYHFSARVRPSFVIPSRSNGSQTNATYDPAGYIVNRADDGFIRIFDSSNGHLRSTIRLPAVKEITDPPRFISFVPLPRHRLATLQHDGTLECMGCPNRTTHQTET
jgi:WD40 repeat protein